MDNATSTNGNTYTLKIGGRCMKEKKIETSKAVVYVYYSRLPTKEDLEDACANFMQKALQDRKAKDKTA